MMLMRLGEIFWVCPFACFISETIQMIAVEFDIEVNT
jgi:hypothetical protein